MSDSARDALVKSLQLYSPYGYRAKIGVVVPSTNVVVEPEFALLAPAGVSLHTTRMLLAGKSSAESFRDMASNTDRCLTELATAEVDVVAWAGTSASLVVSMDDLAGRSLELAGAPMVATMHAVLDALRAVGARSISVGTPYLDDVTRAQAEQLEMAGFSVLAAHGLGLGHTQDERRAIGRVAPQSLFRLVQHIDRPDADAIFLSCTNLATITLLDELEQAFGKPVISSNVATFWRCLRTLGIRDRLDGFGRLLREC